MVEIVSVCDIQACGLVPTMLIILPQLCGIRGDLQLFQRLRSKMGLYEVY